MPNMKKKLTQNTVENKAGATCCKSCNCGDCSCGCQAGACKCKADTCQCGCQVG